MGNTFLQMFLRSAPAVLRNVQGFGSKTAPKFIQKAADTVTNPNTYRALAAQAENVLQRGLPAGFAGPNFGNIPARFTGLISDVSRMPAGLARSTQANMISRALQEAAGNAPRLSRSVQQTAGGALRAPVIGPAAPARQVITGASFSPMGPGGAYGRDPALRRDFLRQFGNTSENAARILSNGAPALRTGPGAGAFPFDDPLTLLQGKARYLQRQAQGGLGQLQSGLGRLQGIGPTALNPFATRNPTTLLGNVGKALNPLNPVNVLGYAAEPLISSFVPEQMRGTVRAGLYTPGGLPAKVVGGTLYDMFMNQSNAGVGLGTGTLKDNDPKTYARLQKMSGSVNSGGPRNFGPNYKEQEARAFAAAQPSSQSFSAPVQQQQSYYAPPPPVVTSTPPSVANLAPAERNYELEKMRAAQLAEQDQLSKKYKIAELTRAYNTATDNETKNRIGMEIWATTNPELAQQLSPEQPGYAAPAPAVSNDQEAMIRYLFNRGLQ